jgi:hypothetical protein
MFGIVAPRNPTVVDGMLMGKESWPGLVVLICMFSGAPGNRTRY